MDKMLMSLDFFLIYIPNAQTTDSGVIAEKWIWNQVPDSKLRPVRITFFFKSSWFLTVLNLHTSTESRYISSESHESIPVAFSLSSLVNVCLSQVSLKTLCYLLKISASHIKSVSDGFELSLTWECAWPIQKLFHRFHYLCQPLHWFD